MTRRMLGVALVALGLGCRRESPRVEPAPAPVDTRSPERRRLEESLAKTPCDHEAMSELLVILVDSDPSKAIEWVASYLNGCGEDAKFRGLKLTAHRRIKQWDSALAEANVLVTMAPRDATPLRQRAEIYEETGQVEDAIFDYREALRIEPGHGPTSTRLANLYEREGRGCEAVKVLKDAHYEERAARIACDTKAARVASVKTRAGTRASSSAPSMPVNLTPDGNEPSHGGHTHAVIHFTPGRVAHTSAILNGSVRVPMLVDTGASDVAISKRVAQKLGIDVTKLRTVQFNTAGGIRPGWVTTLAEVRVQGLVAHDVACSIGEDKDMGEEGLLGQSFLGRFKTTLDAAHGEIDITTR